MRTGTLAAGLVALAGCSGQPQPTDNAAATIQPAPVAPQPEPSAPDRRVTETAPPVVPGPAPTPPPGEPALPEPGAPRPTTSLPEGPFARGGGQAAANVVQTFAALIEQGRVRQALRLWDDGARPKDAAVAARLAKYRGVHARVGGPGDVEGAAGSRYVTVPIHVTARLKAGKRPVAANGTVTLRRVAAVDGATAEQQRWHILKLDLKPVQPRR